MKATGIVRRIDDLSEGDLLGLVLFISDSPAAAGDAEYKLAQTVAAFLGRHMEN